uniref:RING-CH-type domain-containing protein n=1 Tax=Solanum lycopersicum TaxID=4081 RepID=A0A3Q7FVP9_SOLLC
MGDHFVFLVDRLLTESTLEAAIESRNQNLLASWTTDDPTAYCSSKSADAVLAPGKMVECRICQDEDMDSNMEAPCACCGSLKYAHRRCVQRWCNEKGDTICEICHQPFRPGYTAPPSIFRLGGIPMNLRGNWRIVRRNLNNQRVIAVVSTDHNLINSDENEVYTSRCMMCCRGSSLGNSLCVQWLVPCGRALPSAYKNRNFMLLLVIRNTLPLIVDQAGDYSLPLVMLLLLRVMGIVLPVYVIMKAVISCHHRQHQQATLPISSSREEASLVTLQQEPPITAIQ